MSLDCEGDGAPCVECGEFDFLPYTCPTCRGIFCAAHASCHHVPGTASTDSDDAAPPLCAPPAEASPTPSHDEGPQSNSPGNVHDDIRKNNNDCNNNDHCSSSSSKPFPQVRCVVCGGFPCVLTPCPQCGETFCAAHRFHGHEAAALQERLRRRGERMRTTKTTDTADAAASQQDSSELTSALGGVRAACTPFTAAHPLSLAPVGYRSRRMDLLAVVVRVRLSEGESAVLPSGAPAAASLAAEDVGLCSLVVATEMAVGQLRDRLEVALCSAPEANAGLSVAFEGMATGPLFTLAPTINACRSEVGEAASSARRTPTLALVPLPVDAILRKAPILNAAVVLVVVDGSAEVAVDQPALCRALTGYLYSAGVSAATHRDDRVKALATRLYLQHQQLLRRGAAAASDVVEAQPVTHTPSDSSASVATQEIAVESTPKSNLLTPQQHGQQDATREEGTSLAEWPFQHPSPLNSFPFFNSKLRPCGVAAIRPPTAPRVVVALFLADAPLPCALQPMCIALGKEWPLARVVDRLREEVAEQQLTAAHRTRVVSLLKSYSLYRLTEADNGTVELLWDGATATAAGTSISPLQNADVLVLCPSASPPMVAALRAEVMHLHQLTGKEKRALKADQLKLCAMM